MKSLSYRSISWPLSLAGCCLLAGVLLGPSARAGGINRTIVTPILHTGDPAPGIDGATVVWVGKPQIDAGGAVSFEGFIAGDGVDASNNLVLWYGPPGGLAVAAREGDQVPGLPPGVIYDDWEVTYTMGEDGTLSIGAILIGPGVIPGLNDKALLVGPAGDLQMMIRAGDPAPGMAPGVAITTEGNYAAVMADDGRFMTRFHFAGPGIDETNDEAYWAADAMGWHLIVRTGDPAPGTDPGATFLWIDGAKFNNSLSIAFRGGLTGPSVNDENDTGYWSGSPGNVQLVARAGNPAPDLDPGVVFMFAGSLPSLEGTGGMGFSTTVVGDGIDSENDRGAWVGPPGDVRLVVREGDPLPGLDPSIQSDAGMRLMLSESGHMVYISRLRGAVDPSNDRAAFFGGPEGSDLTLREGDSVPGFPPGIVFDDLRFVVGVGAMNDEGDVVTGIGIAGPGIGSNNSVLIVVRDQRLGRWVPLVRSGTEIDGRAVVMESPVDAASAYWALSGGSDGLRQSFNDERRLVLKLAFDDQSLGAYILELPAPGDFDGDGVLGLLDYEAFLGCVTGPAATEVSPICEVFDVDWDGDVDHADFGLLQILMGVQ